MCLILNYLMHNTNTVDHLFGKGRTVMDSEG